MAKRIGGELKKFLIFLSIIIILVAIYFITTPYRHNLAKIYVTRGDQLSEQSDYNKAVIEYRKARILSPRDAGIAFKIAETYKILQNNQLALSYYIKAKKLDPKNKDYYKALAEAYLDINNSS